MMAMMAMADEIILCLCSTSVGIFMQSLHFAAVRIGEFYVFHFMNYHYTA